MPPHDEAERYRIFAAYNDWANRRLLSAVARLDAAHYHADRGAFFGSVHGTLNHLLVADRIWLARCAGEAPPPLALDAILCDTLAGLRVAREQEDARIIAFAAGLTAERLAGEIRYTNAQGVITAQPLRTALDHVFNHHAHHRGQVHTLVTALAGREAAPAIDLIYFLRETGLGGVRTGA